MTSGEFQSAQRAAGDGSCPEPLGWTVWDIRATQEVAPVCAVGALGLVLKTSVEESPHEVQEP